MAGGPRDDGLVAVAYNVLVPLEDCVPDNSSNIQVLLDGRVYKDYPCATWSTDLAPGWDRYEAWLAHERAAKRRMLDFLHRHCPETRALDEWPTLWACIPPRLAEDLHTIHFTIPPPAGAAAGTPTRRASPRQGRPKRERQAGPRETSVPEQERE